LAKGVKAIVLPENQTDDDQGPSLERGVTLIEVWVSFTICLVGEKHLVSDRTGVIVFSGDSNEQAWRWIDRNTVTAPIVAKATGSIDWKIELKCRKTGQRLVGYHGGPENLVAAARRAAGLYATLYECGVKIPLKDVAALKKGGVKFAKVFLKERLKASGKGAPKGGSARSKKAIVDA
jgi:hypothetical protein